ncbi:hypothetical protein SAMN05421678_10223 [Actinopolymorpha cephalotaxi]|uniref:Polymorphic outer membrane protein repeat-containing protein n=1 Tax=Actinopolymorpha cephalotaxi TaxID=504797 RepID=A0A1I2L9F7_9ACTN|nr:hypothetical protein [Actinopolymorpha cephalotaxi]NYH85007.1 hypothetical protein [Actinopolymorpha cephalotaxi]SFF75865.1 hypothetical protein SAMN05421678_10223 [Actinopolymorpha cephalotaxi]
MRKIRIRHAAVAGVLGLAAAAVPVVANADTTTDVSCDSAALIDAINNAAPGDTLNLAAGCNYILNDSTGALPEISVPLTIHGFGSTIQRDPSASPFRLFTVNSTFNLDRVTLAGGDASASPGGFGGAVAVFSGTTNLTRVTIQNNRGNFSGGLGGVSGTIVTVSRSRIQNNFALVNGGGAANDGTMSLTDTVVTDNHAGQKGGGLANDGRLTVTRTTVNSNVADNVGGGIANLSPGTVSLIQSVVNNNTSNNAPGGIDNEAGAGAVTLSNSVVRGNTPTNCSPTPVSGCTDRQSIVPPTTCSPGASGPGREATGWTGQPSPHKVSPHKVSPHKGKVGSDKPGRTMMSSTSGTTPHHGAASGHDRRHVESSQAESTRSAER